MRDGQRLPSRAEPSRAEQPFGGYFTTQSEESVTQIPTIAATTSPQHSYITTSINSGDLISRNHHGTEARCHRPCSFAVRSWDLLYFICSMNCLKKGQLSLAVADLKGSELRRSKFFHFRSVFEKIWQNHMLTPPSGWLAPPTSGKSWIRHWLEFFWKKYCPTDLIYWTLVELVLLITFLA